MSEIPETVQAEMLAHAKACLPNEACGYLVGDSATGRVQRFVPITNAAGSPTRFVFEPHEQLAAEQAIDAAGEQVIGIATRTRTVDPRHRPSISLTQAASTRSGYSSTS